MKSEAPAHPEVRPGQSIALLQALHILTRDGKMNQDSRRKLKQVYHLYQFIEPLLNECGPGLTLVDHGAGKSYLGFILYDLYFKNRPEAGQVIGVESRAELVQNARTLAAQLGFTGMSFHALDIDAAIESPLFPEQVDVVTALHACNTATDDAIRFGLKKQARAMVLVPCCQAELAAALRRTKASTLADPIAEIWRRPLHTREFGSQLTNVLRCLQLEAHGYEVSVTELVGWEHSLKNELIIANKRGAARPHAARRLHQLLDKVGLPELQKRFFCPQ